MPNDSRLRPFDRAIAVVLIICCGWTLALQYQSNEQRQTSATEARAWRSCMGDQFSALAISLNARSEAGKEKDERTDKVFRAAAMPGTRAQVRAGLRDALSDYFAARTDVKRTQNANPYPAYPNGVCRHHESGH